MSFDLYNQRSNKLLFHTLLGTCYSISSNVTPVSLSQETHHSPQIWLLIFSISHLLSVPYFREDNGLKHYRYVHITHLGGRVVLSQNELQICR